MDGLLLKPFDDTEELVAAVQQALSDSQRKRDAARIKALQPLFEVTESLLSETRSESLLELTINAILGHLRCTNAAYYEHSASEGRFALRAGQGRQLPEFIIQVDASGGPMMLNASGPGDANAQIRLVRAGIDTALFVPIARQRFRGVFFAGRDSGAGSFLDADLDMLQILARQAAAALENARLGSAAASGVDAAPALLARVSARARVRTHVGIAESRRNMGGLLP